MMCLWNYHQVDVDDNALIKYRCRCVLEAKWARPAEQIHARIVLTTSQGNISLIFLVLLFL